MSQIKQLLQLHKKGAGIKSIARNLGISKNTVKSYLHKFSELGKSIDELLSVEDPELEIQFHVGNPAYKDERFEHLRSQLDYFEKELDRVGVNHPFNYFRQRKRKRLF